MPEKSKWEPRLSLHKTIVRCPQHSGWCQRKLSMVPGLSSSVASNELPPPMVSIESTLRAWTSAPQQKKQAAPLLPLWTEA